MAAGIDVFTAGRVWTIKYNGSTATHTLPYAICPFDLIPLRIVWRTDANAVAGNAAILQSQPAGGTATDVYKEVVQGAYGEPTEQKPHAHEQWSGPVVVTQFDNGELLISI
jgi:hypothetical protein